MTMILTGYVNVKCHECRGNSRLLKSTFQLKALVDLRNGHAFYVCCGCAGQVLTFHDGGPPSPAAGFVCYPASQLEKGDR